VIVVPTHRRRLLATVLGMSLMALMGAARGAEAPGAAVVEIAQLRYQGWAATVLPPELAEDLGYLAPLKLEWIGNTISGPQDIQAAVTGDVDFGGAFNGAIAKLIAAHAPIKAVIAYYGTDKHNATGLYVLEDSPIRSPRDLIGRKIGMNTLAAYQEYLLTDYLLRNGLTRDEIKEATLVAGPPINLALLLRARQLDATFLQDIARDKALEQGGIRALATDFGEYGAASIASYVLTDKFIREKPNAARKFVEATARAIEWARATPREEVLERLRKIIRDRHRNEDTSVIDHWKSYGVAGRGGLMSDAEFATYIDWYVAAGQLRAGQVTPAGIYTNRLNPFLSDTASR